MNDLGFGTKANGLPSASAQINMPIIVEKMSWKPFESILDYGCGAGTLTSRYLLPVAEKYSSGITGVDASVKIIECAKEKYSHVLMDFIVGDIMADDTFKWPLQNAKFDKILCLNAVQLFQNYEQLLTRLDAQLKKGGQLALSIPFSQFHTIRRKLSDHPKWSKYFAVIKEEPECWTDNPEDFPTGVKLLLDTLGLRIIDFLSCEETYSYDSANDFADFLMAAVSSGAKDLPKKLLKELRDEILLLGSQTFSVPIESEPFTIRHNYLRCIVEK